VPIPLSRRRRRGVTGKGCNEMGFPAANRVRLARLGLSTGASRWTFSGRAISTDNDFVEAFNGRFRAECLNAHWFLTLNDAEQNWRAGADTETKSACMGRLGKDPRLRCSAVTARTACHRDEPENSSLRRSRGRKLAGAGQCHSTSFANVSFAVVAVAAACDNRAGVHQKKGMPTSSQWLSPTVKGCAYD
jgi:hypothetical protein